MSERTTIGGTVYEAIGSSSSNLLLKCNGTARIQWGSKLIDLIKNGKIASGDSSELIFIIQDESEIKSDGIYVLTTEESDQLWIYKGGNKYNFTNTDLYISASKELNLTVEQKKQALDNIGFYYDTLTEVQQAGIKNGIVYVTDTKTLYTIKDGVIAEFEAKLKTVTVEQANTEGEVINSAVKIVLSILDDEYLILADLRITANYSIHVKDSAQLGSESADKTKGYRLYIEGGTSYLDVDEINVRNGIKNSQYTEVYFEDLKSLMALKKLRPHHWYVIADFQNLWRLPIESKSFNRPIIVRALTENTLYKEGYLFKNHNIKIHYDPTYLEPITQMQVTGTTTLANETTNVEITTRGKITWMKDEFNNEANFDFRDYIDSQGLDLTTLHFPTGDETEDKSIFPKHSHNNKLIIYDLKGTIIKNKIIDDTNTNIVNFAFDDTGEYTMHMYNNNIECRGIVLNPTCSIFTNNTLRLSSKLLVNAEFTNNNFQTIYNTNDNTELDFNIVPFDNLSDNSIFNTINFINSTKNVRCETSINCNFELISLKNVSFKKLKNCIFYEGELLDITTEYNLIDVDFVPSMYPMLYIPTKRKEIYIHTIQNTPTIQIVCLPESIFYRGMILMHSGITPIPDGWAICDGNEYEYNGITSRTPNLINRFIKAVATVEEIKGTDNDDINENGEITLTTDHLPVHSHPHLEHTHTFSDSGTAYDSFTAVTSADEGTVITAVEGGTEGKALTKVNTSKIEVYDSAVAISGSTSSETSKESGWLYKETPKPLKMVPSYYSLIFIMKL